MRRIVVFGHVGQNNLGDEAAFWAVIEAARARLPRVEFLGVSVDPVSTARDFGIPVLPIWRGGGVGDGGAATRDKPVDHRPTTGDETASRLDRLRTLSRRLPGLVALLRMLRDAAGAIAVLPREIAFAIKGVRAMRGSDLFVVAGSQHLNDYVLGPWNFPYTTFKWCVMARLAGARVALLNVGAGPVRTRVGRWLVRATINIACHASFRDSSSIDCVRGLGASVAGAPVPDLVFSLDPDRTVSSGPRSAGPLVIGINPIPFHSADYWVGGGKDPYGRYLQVLAEFTAWLCSRGYEVRYFPTQLTLDPQVIDDLEALLPRDLLSSGKVCREKIKSIDDLGTAIAGMHAIVASRFHGLVFATARRRPVIGIAYASKTRDLLEYMGVGELAVDINALESGDLQARFQQIEERYDEIVEVLDKRLAAARDQLAAQFDSLFQSDRRASAQ